MPLGRSRGHRYRRRCLPMLSRLAIQKVVRQPRTEFLRRETLQVVSSQGYPTRQTIPGLMVPAVQRLQRRPSRKSQSHRLEPHRWFQVANRQRETATSRREIPARQQAGKTVIPHVDFRSRRNCMPSCSELLRHLGNHEQPSIGRRCCSRFRHRRLRVPARFAKADSA